MTDFKLVLTSLYYLIICADENVNEKEMELGNRMMAAEKIDEKFFNSHLNSLKTMDRQVIFEQCLTLLRNLDAKTQTRCMAWMCVVANGDGFMDKEEWTLIYNIYHKELRLPMNDIMEHQKELNRLIYGKSFQSIGVRVND